MGRVSRSNAVGVRPLNQVVSCHEMSTELLSPEYNFEVFCYRVMNGDPLGVMEAASTEISAARRGHRAATREADFRPGSRGRMYCVQLQWLVSMLLNGHVPAEVTPQFRASVRPLVEHLLRRWEIGSLKKELVES